ncbi:MAG: hypothetical protein GY737_13920 [Desulfobacteraceae bacterium]|nr:hypothetical protein [Desulfobacteraceae bacterium]
MTQIELKNAAWRVYGYFFPRPCENDESAFKRAKAELITNLEKDLSNVKAITFDQYITHHK